jgi:primosomal protein N' (replication factor Y)
MESRDAGLRIARVAVDVATRALSEPFNYAVPPELDAVAAVGTPVLVPLGGQRVVGYVVERTAESSFAGELREIVAVLGEPLFRPFAPALAEWIAHEYVCPLADALRLFLPPGGSPSAVAVYRAAGEQPRGAVQAAVYQAVSDRGEMSASELRSIDARYPDSAAALARSGVA